MPDNVSEERHPAARAVRRRDRADRRRLGQQRRDRAGAGAGRRPALLHAVPVREPGQPARPLRDDGAGDHRATCPEVDVFVAGLGTGGTLMGVGQAAQGAQPERPDRGGRAAPGGHGLRACAASTTASSRRSSIWRCWTARSWSATTTRSRRRASWSRREGIFAGLSGGAVLARRAPSRGADGTWYHRRAAGRRWLEVPVDGPVRRVRARGCRGDSRPKHVVAEGHPRWSRCSESVYDAMIAHALDDRQHECCGLLAGTNGVISRAYQRRRTWRRTSGSATRPRRSTSRGS